MPTTDTTSISAEQYRALQRSIVLPSPQQIFDFMVEKLRAKFEGTGIFTYAHADPFRIAITDLRNQLFLLVPRQPKGLLTEASVLAQMVSLVEYDGKTGKNFLNPSDLTDLVESPFAPSLLTDVEDGKLRLNVKPSVSRERITADGRYPYTTWHGIVHAIVFPEVFQSHNMDLVGSQYKSKGTPNLYLDDGKPKLDAYWGDVAFPKWGAPSCGSVIVGS